MQEYLNFKIIVLGPQAVGKTSLITRYINGTFMQSYNVTVGVEYTSKILQIQEGKHLRLQIWDTAGQQLFKAVVRTFYKGISAVFLVYAINSAKSFAELKNWVEQIREHAHQEVIIFLLGAKSDLENQREVSVEQASAYMKEIDAAFFLEISSKTGDQIQTVILALFKLFSKAANILYKKYIANGTFRTLVRPSVIPGFATSSFERQTVSDASRITVTKEKQKTKKKKKCC